MNASSLGLSNTTVLLNGFRDALTPLLSDGACRGRASVGVGGLKPPTPKNSIGNKEEGGGGGGERGKEEEEEGGRERSPPKCSGCLHH